MPLRPSRELRRFESVADLIADVEMPTPLVRLTRIVPPEAPPVYLKLEWMNPFGSIKDRTAKFLLAGMAQRGLLDGHELVEPTSGNTGIALTALANILGLKTTITIPEGVPAENLALLWLLGAKVWPTPDDLCPIDHPKDGAIALAHSIVRDARAGEKYVMPNQYENPDNVRAHYETTGPEIWRQTEGQVTHFFCGFGTCGTITGIGRYLKEQNPAVRVVGIEPQKGHRLPGLKNFRESKQPVILDETVVDERLLIPDQQAYAMTVRLAREEGLLVGPSTGAIVAAAVNHRREGPGVAVAVSPDNAFKYTSYLKDYLSASNPAPADWTI